MKLNLYCGLRAIAYIITEGVNVVKHGIKRVNISFDNYYEFIAGLPVSKRINRRQKRQMRRNLWRFKSRRENLKRLLNKHGYSCDGEISREQILKLRVKALTQKLTNEELYMVVLSLQSKRGYKSLRGVSDNENSEYLKEIEKHEENLKLYPSIAAYLLTLDSSKDIIFMRQSYINEFNAIMEKQAIDEDLRKKIFIIIYYQNPLKKGKVGKCKYEQNRTVAHASNPIYQEFRIWRDVMNIVIYDANKNEILIPFELRKKWFEKCHSGSNLTKASCCKDLGFKVSTSFTWYSGNAIAGNPLAVIKKLTGLDDIQELWQELFSATDNDRLATFLRSKYSFDDYVINELLDLDLSKLGYAEYSVKACRKLLPLMQQVMKLKEAALQVYGVVDFEDVALRNVILEQHFESYKSLIEEIKKQYPITEIQFEIDHLLKQGNKGRKAIAQQKRKDEKFKKENPVLSDYNLLKLQLWKESGGISPYQPDYIIPKEELFTDKYNIDHIVAKSKLFETGYNNMVLSPTDLNFHKQRTTAHEYAMQVLELDRKWDEAVDKFPESKQQFLRMTEADIPDNWISKRQLSDYNTKCFATLTKEYATTNIPNKLINKYLKQWNVNFYSEHDARHYLCKCWVMANMSQETVNYFDKLKYQSTGKHSQALYDIRYELPLIDFANAPVFMPRIKFTRKTKYGYTPRFGLHGETVFGKRQRKYRNAKGEIATEYFYKVRQPIAKLTPAMVEKIMDKAIQRKIKARIEEKGNHEEGILSLVENPATHNGKPIKRVSVATGAERVFALHSANNSGRTSNKNAFDRKVDYVFSDKNYSLQVSVDQKGKVKKTVTSLMEMMDQINGGMRVKDKHNGFNLRENDVVELNGKKYFVIGAGEAIAIRPVHTLSATETHKIKADDWKHILKLHVNQLGDVTKKESIYVNTKD